jgi:iron complex transport system permease protein
MMKNYGKNKTALFIFLAILLFSVVLASLAWGQVYVPVGSMVSVIAQQLAIPGFSNDVLAQEQTAVIWHIRLPRTLVGVLVGAALGVSGAVMQGVLGNPLADPGIVGVASGASLGAVIAIALGITGSSIFYMPFFALAGALLAVGLTVSLAMRDGKIPVMVLLLAGVTVGMLLGAITHGILTFMSEYRLKEYLFWLVGGLDYRRWEHVYLAAGPILAGIAILCFLARHLNILAQGEQEARSVGVPVAFLRILMLFIAAMTTATAVCVSGTIGFVGLIVPHIMRLLIGPEHRILLPACALAGGLFLVACDTLGRMLMAPSEVRVGIMTALLGAPYFLYLLRRVHQGGGLG